MATKHSAFYTTYIKSAAWDDKREQALRHYGHKCRRCNSPFHLQVHHLTYRRLGHERISDLTVLCDTCHAIEHDILEKKKHKPGAIPIKPRQPKPKEPKPKEPKPKESRESREPREPGGPREPSKRVLVPKKREVK